MIGNRSVHHRFFPIHCRRTSSTFTSFRTREGNKDASRRRIYYFIEHFAQRSHPFFFLLCLRTGINLRDREGFFKVSFFLYFYVLFRGGGYFLFKKMIFRSVSKRLSSESIRFICLLMVEVFKDARIRQIVWTMIALKQINKWASNRYEHARQRGKGSPMAVAETREQSI